MARWHGVLRFHVPLIEPDGRVSRIRLSEKAHGLAHERLALARAEVYEPQRLVQVPAGEQGLHPGPHLVLVGQPPT